MIFIFMIMSFVILYQSAKITDMSYEIENYKDMIDTKDQTIRYLFDSISESEREAVKQ